MKIALTVNGEPRVVSTHPLRHLLDILREDLDLTAAKEGCGEGECGACSVLLDGRLVNACLVPAFQAHGRDVRTAEGLGTVAKPDPVQTALVAGNAIQCGFCMPGIAVAARALLDRTAAPDRDAIREGLSGNLCRCTGYGRVIDAVARAAEYHRYREENDPPSSPPAPESDGDGLHEDVDPAGPPQPGLAESVRVVVPDDLADALARLRVEGSRMLPVAGATDLAVEFGLGRPHPAAVLDLSRLSELRGVRGEAEGLVIGACTTFSELAMDSLVGRRAPALAAAAMRVGAPAVRNRATLGGNLVTASPAADGLPPLLILDAEVELAGPAGRRRLPLTEFSGRYRETALAADELLVAVHVPAQPAGCRQAFYKVGTRQAQAIAKASLACRARLDGEGRLRDVRVAAGSVAPTAVLLAGVAEWLEGRFLAGDVAAEAGRMAAAEVKPIDDIRSTGAYRRHVVGTLLTRFLTDLIT